MTNSFGGIAGWALLTTLLALAGCDDDSPPDGTGGTSGTAGRATGGAAGASGRGGAGSGAGGTNAGADGEGAEAGRDDGGAHNRGGASGSGGHPRGGSAGEGAASGSSGSNATGGSEVGTGGSEAGTSGNGTGGSEGGTGGTEAGTGGEAGADGIDLCATDNGGCDPVAECTDGDRTRWCVCPPGYRGDGITCTLIDPCPCENGGKCVDYKGNVECECVQGTSGPTCNLRTKWLVSAGTQSCSLMTDDSVRCWGAQQTPDTSSTPPFVELAAGGTNTCGLTAAGDAYCWRADWPVERVSSGGVVTSVRTGGDEICTLRNDGQVSCSHIGSPFGMANDVHPVGGGGDTTWIVHGDGWTSSWGERPGPSRPVKAFAVGHAVGALGHSCNIEVDGTLTCEGNNDAGQASPPPGTFIALSLGRQHGCALTPDYTVQCWGDNTYGQSTPPSGTFAQISAGDDHTCGLHFDYRVECWGRNDSGQATADTNNLYMSVSAGGAHTCGRRTDNSAYCWGNNDYGQANAPASFGGGQKMTEVVAGARHSCAIDGGLLRCWGDNSRGQAPPSEDRYGLVAAGREHTCAVDQFYRVFCWGNGDAGQTTPRFQPTTYQSIALGSHSSGDLFCGILTDGRARCTNDVGYPPGSTVYPPPPGLFKSVAVGRNQACAISTDDTVRCWGDQGGPTPPSGAFTSLWMTPDYVCGLRPNGMPECWGMPGVDWPTLHPPAEPFTMLSTGRDFACGLREDGTTRCWGNVRSPGATVPGGVFSSVAYGVYDYCGIRPSGSVYCTDSHGASLSAPPGPFADVSLGYHACGRRPDGSLECWGSDSSAPPRGTFRAVSVGNTYYGGTPDCAVRDDGTLVCWGANASTSEAPPPGRYIGVSMGRWQGVAVRTDHQAVCWGKDGNDYPCPMPPADDFLRVDAAYENGDDACGLRTDGTLQCWHRGFDGSGNAETSLWTDVPTGTFSSVSVGAGQGAMGSGQACGLRPDGTAQCFNWTGYSYFLPGLFDALDIGDYYAASWCGVRPDGHLECRGRVNL